MKLINSLKTFQEEMLSQMARNLFPNNGVDPDYENVRVTLSSAKIKVPLAECLQDIREREDDLKQHSNQERKSEKTRRASQERRLPKELPEEPPSK